MFLGDVEIDKAYLGNNLVFQNDSEHVVVSIPYIRGGADGSYIDTGIVPDNNTRVIVWARNFNPPVASQMLFGYMDSGANTNSFGIGAWGAASCGRIAIYFANYTNPYAYYNDAWTCLGGYHKYELDGKTLKIDDEIKATSTSTDTITTVHSMHLFGRNTGGTHTPMNVPADICACKIYKNGTLVRDFTAVETPSVGLYDAVSQTLFTNAGSGSFTYGEFDKNAYTPLEYISCANNQWFDSGVYGSYSLPIVVKYMPTNTTARWTGLLGEFSNSKTECCGFSLGTASRANVQLSFRLGPSTSDVVLLSNYSQTNKAMVLVKNNNVATVYENTTQRGTATKSGVATTFTTSLTLTVCATRNTSTAFTDSKFEGRLYHVGFGSQRNFVPAKVNGVAGMYDTYHDVFYPSATSTPFVAGTVI